MASDRLRPTHCRIDWPELCLWRSEAQGREDQGRGVSAAGPYELFGASPRTRGAAPLRRAGGRHGTPLHRACPASPACRRRTIGGAGSQCGGLRRRSIITERKRSSGKVRRVRMLGIGLAALFALSAMTAVPALARNMKVFGRNFKHCPYEQRSEVDACTYEASGPARNSKLATSKSSLKGQSSIAGWTTHS